MSGGGTSSPAYRPGDHADFDRLYRASYSRILFTLLAMLHDQAAAEDCVQETFVRAFKAWPRWTPDAPAEAWVHRIAVNVGVSYRRHARLREVGETLRRLGRPGPGRDPAAAAVEDGSVLTALRRLPAEQAALVVLRHHHGYSNREIATALGIPESTVSSRLGAARRKLQEELADSAPAGDRRLPLEESVRYSPGDVRFHG